MNNLHRPGVIATAVYSGGRWGHTGILAVTESGILFEPAINMVFGAGRVKLDVTEIKKVEVAPRTFWPIGFDGRYFHRLIVETQSQGEHFFLVWDVYHAVVRVRETLWGKAPETQDRP